MFLFFVARPSNGFERRKFVRRYQAICSHACFENMSATLNASGRMFLKAGTQRTWIHLSDANEELVIKKILRIHFSLPPSRLLSSFCCRRRLSGETRDKKEFSRRQLELPKHNIMVCRHCNEAEKFAAKEERRNALELSKQLKEPKNEISNRQ